ncbi:hypothetical protein [Luteolibacter soli]|uniref:SMI1/KNR4 family protein n=1 Tax=Luteolibacter soli TaxID=3135280 RepID=A0ABU9ASZ4_9BACT
MKSELEKFDRVLGACRDSYLKKGAQSLFWVSSEEERDEVRARLQGIFGKEYPYAFIGNFPNGDMVAIAEDGALVAVLHDCGEVCPSALTMDEFLEAVREDEELEDRFYLLEESDDDF